MSFRVEKSGMEKSQRIKHTDRDLSTAVEVTIFCHWRSLWDLSFRPKRSGVEKSQSI